MKYIRVIVQKEWAEIFKHRMVLFTVVLMPLLMTAIPLAVLFSMRGESSLAASDEIPEQFRAYCTQDLAASDCMSVFLVNQFMLLFMIVPLAIPSTIAAYSIIGEKTNRSLEPLLATPISTVQLLVGKALAALLPAVAATYTFFGIFLIGARLIPARPPVLRALLDSHWLLGVFALGPLLALASIMLGIIVSSRVNEPRVAEQISALLIMPLLALFFGQMSGWLIMNKTLVLSISLALVLIDAALLYLAVQTFQRENILTRWK